MNLKPFHGNLLLIHDFISSKNSFLTVLIEGLNAESSKCCINDKTTYEGSKTDFLPSLFGLHQLLNLLIFLIEHFPVLILTSQPNLAIVVTTS